MCVQLNRQIFLHFVSRSFLHMRNVGYDSLEIIGLNFSQLQTSNYMTYSSCFAKITKKQERNNVIVGKGRKNGPCQICVFKIKQKSNLDIPFDLK